MANNLVLKKESSENDIRAYFKGVLEISQSKDEFPVNLDDVWMLVYSGKEKAVRALKENFMQDVDYQVLAQNGENSKAGRPTNVYMLSVSCLEFFIARKIRPVFEVYRQVFHRAAKNPEQLSRKDLALMVIKAEEEKERLQLENTKIKEENEQIKGENEIVKLQNEQQSEQLKQQAPKVEYVDKVLSSPTTYSTNLIAKEMGMSAVTLNRQLKEKGVQYKQGGVWILTHKYQNKGYTATRTSTYTRSDGTEGTSMLTVWTEKGRKFIHDLFAA